MTKATLEPNANLTLLPLINPYGEDDISDRKIWKGNTTGIMNLNSVRFNWAVQLYKQMRQNIWIK